MVLGLWTLIPLSQLPSHCIVIFTLYIRASFFNLLFYVYKCLPTCISVHHVCAWCSQRPEKGMWFSRSWGTGGVSHHVVLEINPRSSGGPASALNHQATFPAPWHSFLNFSHSQSLFLNFYLLFLFCLFKTGFLCVLLSVLELFIDQDGLELTRSACLYLISARI